MAPHDRLTGFLASAIRVLGIGLAALLIACQTVRTTEPGAIGVEREHEADRIGVELAARAGYDPRAAVTLRQKMIAIGGKGGPEFLSTHPSAESRQRDVSAYADKTLPLYEAARKQ